MVALVTRLAAAAVALAALAVAQDDGVLVHVMSFNVRTSHAADDAKATCSNWNGVRKDNVVAQIKNVAPDFFGTQETSDEQKVFLDAQLAGTYVSLGKSTGSLDGSAPEINSLHYKIADWKPLEDGVFWLVRQPVLFRTACGYRTLANECVSVNARARIRTCRRQPGT